MIEDGIFTTMRSVNSITQDINCGLIKLLAVCRFPPSCANPLKERQLCMTKQMHDIWRAQVKMPLDMCYYHYNCRSLKLFAIYPHHHRSKYTTRASKTKLYKYSKTSNEIFGDLPCITAITKPSNVHRAPHWSFSKTTVVIKKKKLTVIYFTYVKMSIFSVLIVFSG